MKNDWRISSSVCGFVSGSAAKRNAMLFKLWKTLMILVAQSAWKEKNRTAGKYGFRNWWDRAEDYQNQRINQEGTTEKISRLDEVLLVYSKSLNSSVIGWWNTLFRWTHLGHRFRCYQSLIDFSWLKFGTVMFHSSSRWSIATTSNL